MFEQFKDKNIEAGKSAAVLVTGRTATNVVMDKLISRLPFLTRLFKGNEVKNNELARLAAAQAVLALQLQFAPDNEKLGLVSDAMIKSTMADVALNSKALKDVAKTLENLIP